MWYIRIISLIFVSHAHKYTQDVVGKNKDLHVIPQKAASEFITLNHN